LNCAAAILAGGKATRRGGQPKALLTVGGETILERQLRVLRPLFAPIILVANEYAPYAGFGLTIVPDVVPGDRGPLVGILSALEAAGSGHVVCLACDMPMLCTPVLTLLRDYAPDAQAVVPAVSGHDEPLHARYATAAAPVIRAQLSSGDFKVRHLLARLRTARPAEAELRALDPSLTFATNINTPAELLALRRAVDKRA
jgi:molybdopterin-guanine dinucleotide biosynthesis protein A